MAPTCVRNLRSDRVRFYRIQPDDVRIELVVAWKGEVPSVVLRAFLDLIDANASQIRKKLVFNRTILMGDASFVIRPHMAASTSKGIANAFALVSELAGRQKLPESLEHWQRSELNRGQRLMSYGQGLGGHKGAKRKRNEATSH